MVQQLQLSGHTGPVTCLAHSSSAASPSKKKTSQQNPKHTHCCLLSGSEDGTIRLWDLRNGNTRASLCILSPNREEISSVAFHPTFDDNSNNNGISSNGTSTGGASMGQYPFTVYASIGSSVYGYDLRQTKSPIIKEYHCDLTNHLNGGEEINQITFSSLEKNNKNPFFAVADDDGYARVTDKAPRRACNNNSGTATSTGTDPNSVSSKIPFKTLHHDVDDSCAMVTSIAFRPRCKTVDLVTGGTDCTVNLWDVNRPRRPSSSIHITRDDAGANQICNPPIVHSLSWSSSGRLLAAGLGDGSTSVLSVEGRKLVEGCRLRGGHDAAVAAVLFPRFFSGLGDVAVSSSHVTADDRMMISAGNDGSIIFWDLGTKVAGKFAVDPSTVFEDCKSDTDDTVMNDADADATLEQQMEGLSTNESDANVEEPKILFGLQHNKKANWIESSTSSEPSLPTSLFIADTSNDITAYILSRI